MKKWLVPLVCVALITVGGCGGKKPGDASKSGSKKPIYSQLEFERQNAVKSPQRIITIFQNSITEQSHLLVEDKGHFWVIVTRGEKRTGGYEIEVSKVELKQEGNGRSTLIVSYTHSDPAPGAIVTQALTYPADLILIKGLTKAPDEVRFIKE